MNIVCGGLHITNTWDFLFLDSCEINLVGEDFWTIMELVLPTPCAFFPMASIDNSVIITGIT